MIGSTPVPPHPPHPRPSRWLRRLGWAAAALALASVFAAYLQPDMALQLAQQLWSCF